MNIAITGGTGLVGSALTGYFTAKGHHLFILTRNTANKQDKENITFVEWLQDESVPEQKLTNIDVFINLAGASLNSRWTKRRKKLILESRTNATREVIRIIGELSYKPKVLINASAVGYYGVSKRAVFTESSPSENKDFLQSVCEAWETEAAAAESAGVRTVYARFGLILDNKEGALPSILLPYKLFAGGRIGSGEQWYSWVHLRDVVELINFAIFCDQVKGALNVTAPCPEKMKNFGKTLAKTINRPHWLPVPAYFVHRLFGEMSTLITEGQKVIPRKALSLGYHFSYPELDEAFADLLENTDDTA
ncbi:TIGR01777 family oxidoreductase [Bacillus piscicola]|uniref:TIGR01777 family oxidoreductase n=1 Tax=Bacillus piscicola TaxID=1632684 RepID=UPI001F096FF1